MKRFLCFAFVLTGFLARAQDPLFTQTYSAPQYVNPAFAGPDTNARVDLVYRLQWPKLSGAFSTFFGGYQQYISKLNGYGGINFMYDHVGELTKTQYNLQYTQNIKLGKKMVLRPAVEIGYFQRKIEWSALTFPNTIDPRTGFVLPIDDAPRREKTRGLDLSAGLLFYWSQLYLGFSVHHIAEPNQSFYYWGNSPLPRNWGAQVGYTINYDISDNIYFNATPYFNWNKQGNFDTYTAGLNLNFNNSVMVGGGYRYNDAVLLNAGYRHGIFRIMYSYDITANNLTMDTGGSHEVSLSLFFWKQKANTRFVRMVLPT